MVSAVQPILVDSAAAAEQRREFDTLHRTLQQDYARQAADALSQLVVAGTEAP
jgi:hypothetical protein